jgi:hypothetical protein
VQWVKVTRWVLIGGGILFCMVLAALFLLLPKQPKRAVQATVTFIGPQPDVLTYGPSVRIVARTADGRIGQISVPAHLLRCKVGDRIRATSRGTSVYLDQSSCAHLGRYD